MTIEDSQGQIPGSSLENESTSNSDIQRNRTRSSTPVCLRVICRRRAYLRSDRISNLFPAVRVSGERDNRADRNFQRHQNGEEIIPGRRISRYIEERDVNRQLPNRRSFLARGPYTLRRGPGGDLQWRRIPNTDLNVHIRRSGHPWWRQRNTFRNVNRTRPVRARFDPSFYRHDVRFRWRSQQRDYRQQALQASRLENMQTPEQSIHRPRRPFTL